MEGTETLKSLSGFNIKSIVLNAGMSFVAGFATLALGMAIKMMLARLITPSDLGLLLTAQMIIGMAISAGNLGLPDAAVRFIGLYAEQSMGKAKAVLMGVLRFTIPASILVCLALSFGADFLAIRVYDKKALSAMLILWAIVIPVKIIVDMMVSAYRGIGVLWIKVIFADLVPPLLIGSFLLIFVFVGFPENTSAVLIIVGIYLCANCISLLLVIAKYFRDQIWRIPLDPVNRRELIRYSLPLYAAGFMAWPMGMIPLVLGAMVNTEAVAAYSLSISLAAFIFAIVSAMDMAAFPVFSAYIGRGDFDTLREDYTSLTRWGFVLASFISVPCIICPETLVDVVYGSEYVNISPVLRAFGCMSLATTLTGPCEVLLKGFGDARWIFWSRFTVAVTVTLLLYPFIQIWGLQGAVAIYLCSSVIGFGMYGGYLMVKHHIHPINPGLVKTILAVLLALTGVGFARLLLAGIAPILSMVMIFILYGIVLLLLLFSMRAFSSRDIHSFRAFLRKIGLRAVPV